MEKVKIEVKVINIVSEANLTRKREPMRSTGGIDQKNIK